ncbi:MAG: polysulfide reductase NrfD [Thermodesulfovibrionales bacterium]|nr:polysulfide reductase NrfD [Thermodesulfovibrionales bacterium]
MTHAHGELWTIKELFTYPNEFIYWTVHIAVYPYLTGLVAGAFVLSSLYHVFGKKELKPVAKFSLVFSFALLIMAPQPLLLFHLTQPQRAFNVFFTPHFYSAIAAFGVVFSAYMAIVGAEIWFAYRPFIVEQAHGRKGIMGLLYKTMTLGSYDLSDKALHTDEKIVKILAAIGIPSAAFLHGYVGFIFGSVKTVALWKTPLMPFIFLMSAIISGVALCIATYIVGMKLFKRTICPDTVRSMGKVLAGFIIIAFILESIDIVFHSYTAEEFWGILSVVLFERVAFDMFVVQWGLGMIVPLIMLLLPKVGTLRAFIASALVLNGVFVMRWNVVIGGQSMSKSFAGFMQYKMPIIPYNLETLREGLVAVIFLLVMPFVLLCIFNKILPVFPKRKGITASDIMTHMPLTVTTKTPVEEVADILVSKNISGVPVVDSNKKVVGVLSESDVIFRKEADSLTAKDIMTAPPVTAYADTSLAELRQIMADKHIKRIIITDKEGHAAGIVSRIDVVRAQEMGECQN